jgi:hypothetical protein
MADEPKLQELPPTVDQLIDLLNTLYPEHSGEEGWSHARFLFMAGKRDLVRHLNQLRAWRDETPLIAKTE